MSGLRLTFLPEGRSLELAEATPVSDAAAAAELLIDHPCGAKATCGKCRVRFAEGATAPTAAEERLVSAEDLAQGWRLSCQAVVNCDAVIEVPAVSRAAAAKTFGPEDLFAGGFEATLRTVDLAVEVTESDDLASALRRSVAARIGRQEIRIAPHLLRALPGLISDSGARVSAVIGHGELLALAGETQSFGAPCGVALDIGSTTLGVAIINMETCAVLAQGSALNPQVAFGADTISRIFHTQTHDDGNAQLHGVLAKGINELVGRLAAEAAISRDSLWRVCAVGNPTMLHTLLGVDVGPLGQAPYNGAWTMGIECPAREAGLDMRREAMLSLPPMIRSNVGADTMAAILATGLDQTDKLSLLIDLGTNSEIVLGNRHKLIATSTAAGPAFEGANIRQGMRAAPGAIDRVSLRGGGRVNIHVLGSVPAKGICGPGLIDAVAILLRAGLIDATGRMHGRNALDEKQYPGFAARIVSGEHGHPAFILATREESEKGVPVMLSALDVRQLQLIKGSIYAGAEILMKQLGVHYDDLDQVLIAGAFGQYVRKASALDIGLVPPVDPEKVLFVGNAAGVGARMCLVDAVASRRAEEIWRTAEYVELGGHPDYQDAFCVAMGFHDSPAVKARQGD
ncbi:MAG: ASKHA domain-containing protein [Candidatus Sumerlaeaceae bacterium]|nr:ASKHA domain-containing protein [Candidatus Sumerlaeaceae bacterium]